MNYLKYTLTLLLSSYIVAVNAQDDFSKLMEDSASSGKNYTLATFKTTRVINFHTVETVGERTLDFRISHRFGEVNGGVDNFWGIDGGASIRLGLEYSYDGRLMAGFGRTSYQKMLDGFLKYKLLRQTVERGMPVTATLFASMYCTTGKDPLKQLTGFDRYENFYSRLSYNYQLIVGRKFNQNFSAQIAPWFVHYNQVDGILDGNDIYGVSAALRYKFTKRMALTAEYAYRINDYTNKDYYDSFGVGFEIETGGHVFQMHVTNSFGLAENQFLPYTNTKWGDGGIRIGFNISRVFTL
ncbi:MAG: hypothetical protein IPN36_18970 [Bacteroidetes bacterium]|jgi:hypothetical protein|nr:hypothetical protein [Bacteroidota bacterium]MBL0095341.1 hypothetical protein [Bacteroidota bacterium]